MSGQAQPHQVMSTVRSGAGRGAASRQQNGTVADHRGQYADGSPVARELCGSCGCPPGPGSRPPTEPRIPL